MFTRHLTLYRITALIVIHDRSEILAGAGVKP